MKVIKHLIPADFFCLCFYWAFLHWSLVPRWFADSIVKGGLSAAAAEGTGRIEPSPMYLAEVELNLNTE